MSMYDQWVADIPAQFQGKQRLDAFIRIMSTQLDELFQMLDDVETKTTLEGAEGVQLDRIGEIVNISRQEALQLLNGTNVESITDEVYKAVLYFKILKNNTDCTYYDIMKGLHYLWDFEKAVLTYEENPWDDKWVNGYDVEFVTALPSTGVAGTTYFLETATSHLFDRYVYESNAWQQEGSSLLTDQEESDMRNKTLGRNAPATLKLGIMDIPTDCIDPVYVEPMVIRSGGVNIKFESSYRDEIDPTSWERFTNLCIGFETNHEWNGVYYWDDTIEFHPESATYENTNKFDATYKWDGTIKWGPLEGGLEVIDMDAVFLQQARRKTLRLRALGGEEGWKIKYMVWGDGLASNGSAYTPTYDQTELKHEILRKEISYHYNDGLDTMVYVGFIDYDELVGSYVSEFGLADADGELVCIKTFEKKFHMNDRSMMFKIDDTILQG